MGIPDTYTMPISNTQIFIEESICHSQEHNGGLCSNAFWRAFFPNNKEKSQLLPSAFFNKDFSDIFTSKDIMKATNIKKFTPAEIKKATSNYSQKNIIGEGSSGIVFKGKLHNNQLIAVKRHSGELPFHGKDNFVNEIIILSQINSLNVVKLLGCCFETDVPSIVYEYIPNGTLYDNLFDERKSCLLTWNHRLRIAAQVAQVLANLHTTGKVPIIHRDIASTNVLLDDKYMAKVSDFGISKVVSNQYEFKTVVEDTRESDCVFTRVMGTSGYTDPEYLCSGRLTKQSDVYSFGVVLAELLTSKKANTFGGDLVSKFLKWLESGRLVKILDEQLVNERSMEQLKKVAHLAGRCLQIKSEDRPTMRQVETELQDIIGF